MPWACAKQESAAQWIRAVQKANDASPLIANSSPFHKEEIRC
jgi:hypothetical protein